MVQRRASATATKPSYAITPDKPDKPDLALMNSRANTFGNTKGPLTTAAVITPRARRKRNARSILQRNITNA